MLRRTKRPAARRGFTLMELLLVMGILVILLTMVVPKLISTQKKANANAAKIQVGMFRKAAEEGYMQDMNTFPTTEQGLVALLEAPSDVENSKSWNGPYVESVPKDPWGHDYQYAYPGTHNEKKDMPDIWSLGPDGEDGTDDDIGNWTDEEEEETNS
jgi:general secretion pathway protein G